MLTGDNPLSSTKNPKNAILPLLLNQPDGRANRDMEVEPQPPFFGGSRPITANTVLRSYQQGFLAGGLRSR